MAKKLTYDPILGKLRVQDITKQQKNSYVSSLANKADLIHTHTTTDITDFEETAKNIIDHNTNINSRLDKIFITYNANHISITSSDINLNEYGENETYNKKVLIIRRAYHTPPGVIGRNYGVLIQTNDETQRRILYVFENNNDIDSTIIENGMLHSLKYTVYTQKWEDTGTQMEFQEWTKKEVYSNSFVGETEDAQTIIKEIAKTTIQKEIAIGIKYATASEEWQEGYDFAETQNYFLQGNVPPAGNLNIPTYIPNSGKYQPGDNTYYEWAKGYIYQFTQRNNIETQTYLQKTTYAYFIGLYTGFDNRITANQKNNPYEQATQDYTDWETGWEQGYDIAMSKGL